MMPNARDARFFARAFSLALLLPVLAVPPGGAAGGEADLPAFHRARLGEIQARIAAQGLHWSAGMTSLTAYTPAELERMLGLRLPEERLRQGDAGITLPYPVRRDLPARYDWREHGGMTPVKNQGGCGSCWDFAGCGALEASIKIHGGVELDLSEQQVLSCATPGWGCGGGWSTTAWQHFRDHGAVSESCMPYQADDDVPCTEDACDLIAATREWINVPSHVDAIKTAIFEYGPVTTGFAVQNDFFYYTGGCYERDGDYNVNHEMVIAGWDDAACDGEGAWLVKNSWSEGWGESGYVWIKYGTCKVGTNCGQVFYDPAADLECAAVAVADGRPAAGSGRGNGAGLRGEGAGRRGDGDERLDPGETADLAVTIRNGLLAEARSGITARLSSASDLVTITQADASAPDLAPGETAPLAPAFTVAASPYAAIGAEIEFELAVSANGGYAHRETFALQIGDVPVLLVDDDEGTIADPFFKAALADGGYRYRVWDTSVLGSPSGAALARHPAVVWVTGVAGRLDEGDQEAIDAYRSAGGGLCVSGQDIGWFMNDWGGATPEDRFFYEHSLHAVYVADDAGFRHLDGVPGDPLSDGLSFDIGGGDGSCSQDYPSRISAHAGGVPILSYGPGVTGAVRYQGDYRLAYCAFGIEAINTAPGRAQVLARTLEYLVEEWPDIEQPTVTVLSPMAGDQWWPGTEVTIAWEADDNVAVASVDIRLSRDGGATFPELLAGDWPDEGSFVWMVSGEASAACRIEVIVRDGAGLLAHSYSELFAILGEASGAGPAAGSPPTWGFAVQPNPLVRSAWLQLTAPRAAEGEVTIQDVGGRVVRVLHRGSWSAGTHRYVWRGTDDRGGTVPGGIYFARVTVRGGERFVRRILLLR